jgi:hypothetical protein
MDSPSAAGKSPAGKLRFAIRKAFAEAEVVLEEWDAAGEQGAAILRSVQNAAVRLRDFVQQAGRLGIVSAMGDAEEVLKVCIRLWLLLERTHVRRHFSLSAATPLTSARLHLHCCRTQISFPLRPLLCARQRSDPCEKSESGGVEQGTLTGSIERLLRAIPPVMALLAVACTKLQKLLEQLLLEQAELQPLCSCEELWEGTYPAQPSVAEMSEWLHDALIALRRELALRTALVGAVGCESDDAAERALDLWEAAVFFEPRDFAGRAEAVKIHCVLGS